MEFDRWKLVLHFKEFKKLNLPDARELKSFPSDVVWTHRKERKTEQDEWNVKASQLLLSLKRIYFFSIFSFQLKQVGAAFGIFFTRNLGQWTVKSDYLWYILYHVVYWYETYIDFQWNNLWSLIYFPGHLSYGFYENGIATDNTMNATSWK